MLSELPTGPAPKGHPGLPVAEIKSGPIRRDDPMSNDDAFTVDLEALDALIEHMARFTSATDTAIESVDAFVAGMPWERATEQASNNGTNSGARASTNCKKACGRSATAPRSRTPTTTRPSAPTSRCGTDRRRRGPQAADQIFWQPSTLIAKPPHPSAAPADDCTLHRGSQSRSGRGPTTPTAELATPDTASCTPPWAISTAASLRG